MNATSNRNRSRTQEGAKMDKILNKLAGEDKNFPLIEVMVVIACIGILVTIAIQKLLAQ